MLLMVLNLWVDAPRLQFSMLDSRAKVDDNYDLSGPQYMGVGLPYTEFQCSLVCNACPINANTGWAASHPLVAYNQREFCATGSHACTCYTANGCLYETGNARSQVVHPICTNSTG